ncbi:ABC transporter substrate-binding protein [Bradyrhizobium sp. CSA207]|uniref:ABC transporter substrate-binding protein n=1 Tax=Bradyrhizobium sp. CSA207 TaxID=2698826 RepID=UPI0023B1391A|nr:ABC transporter substrate-binding protein [Bradyrhizobium sp. CSA207]MDE5441776.1 ABC transporter substrate-binding protein [Bradyrhizobium sp. CSA207]
MRRRDFIMLVAGAAAYPLGTSAQGNMRRIGVMAGGKPSDPESQASYQKLRQRLGELGWEQGRNIQIEYRWWAGDPALADAQAAELAGLRPDVLLAISTPSVEALKRHAPTLPIVFTVVADPVGAGFVQSLGKPGGNITGFTTFEPEMAGKWLQLLKQAAPEIRRVAAVFNPRTAPMILMPSVEAAIPAVQLQLVPAPADNATELEQTISRFAEQPHGGLLIFPDAFPLVHRQLILNLAATHRLPAMYPFPFFVTEGGLMSYGISISHLVGRSADYVDRVLRGARPADLPVQQPNEFQFLLNLKTANALGLSVPPTLVAQADQVVE